MPGTSVELVRNFLHRGWIVSTVVAAILPLVVLARHPPSSATVLALLGLFVIVFGSHALLRSQVVRHGAYELRGHAEGRRRATNGRVLVLAIGALAAVTASSVGVVTSPEGWAWILLPGLLASDAFTTLRARSAWWWFCASALITGLGTAIAVAVATTATRSWTDDPVIAGAVAVVAVGAITYLDPPGGVLLRRAGRLEEEHRGAIELARTRERLRLSEDLHDILGHALEVVAFKSELAARVVDRDPERGAREMTEVQQLARSAVTDVRSLVRDQRPTDVRAETLAAQVLLGSADIDVTVDLDVTPLGHHAENILGRVVREAVTNILRHSDASRVAVRAVQRAGDVEVVVEDDGSARSTAASPGGASTRPVGGTGLAGARRRLQAEGGDLEAGPMAEGGFAVVAHLPVTALSTQT